MLLQKAPFIWRAFLIKDAALGHMAAARIICLDTKGWLQPLLPQGSLEGSVHCLASLCSKEKPSEPLNLCGITDLGFSQSKFILFRAAPEWKSRKSALLSYALFCCCVKHLGSRGCLGFQLLIKHSHIAELFSETGMCSSFKELLRTDWRAEHWLRRLQRECRSSVPHKRVLLVWEFSRQWMCVVCTHNLLYK